MNDLRILERGAAHLFRVCQHEVRDAEDMAEIPRATSTEGTAQDRQRLGEKLASDAATAQVMRAVNVYRARLGYGPQEGGDGTEAAGGDM